MKQEVERVIRAYFEECAGVKLEQDPDGTLFDRDSNWGFDPAELAAEIIVALGKAHA